MISVFDNFLLSDYLCERIKQEYSNKLELTYSDIRKNKKYHEFDKTSWIHKEVDTLIKKAIGSTYSLLSRVTVLKYEKGDYFLKHEDGPSNSRLNSELPHHFYGGVELSERGEFEGGDFYINDNIVDYKKGRIFTHGFSDSHGVKEVISGCRWSIHFLIENNEKNII